MPTTETMTRSDGSILVDVPVSVEGLTVKTKDSEVRWNGEDYSLSDFEGVVGPDAECLTYVSGYLVFDRDAERMTILIDEVVADDEDEPFDFTESAYDVILNLFNVTIPAGASTLEDLNVIVARVLEAEIDAPRKEAREKFAEERKAHAKALREAAEEAASEEGGEA